jgi:hypothetical protein
VFKSLRSTAKIKRSRDRYRRCDTVGSSAALFTKKLTEDVAAYAKPYGT